MPTIQSPLVAPFAVPPVVYQEDYELLNYKSYIWDLAINKKNVLFFNSSPEHASYVMGTMFAMAEKNIKIYAGELSGAISNQQDYRTGLESYLKKGLKLDILLQKKKFDLKYSNEDQSEPDLFSLFRYYNAINPNQITIKKHSYLVMRDGEKEEFHFTTADDCMYRLEKDIVEFTADANFNDVSTVISLNKTFDIIFNKPESELVIL
jgi:hypothetical protein